MSIIISKLSAVCHGSIFSLSFSLCVRLTKTCPWPSLSFGNYWSLGRVSSTEADCSAVCQTRKAFFVFNLLLQKRAWQCTPVEQSVLEKKTARIEGQPEHTQHANAGEIWEAAYCWLKIEATWEGTSYACVEEKDELCLQESWHFSMQNQVGAIDSWWLCQWKWQKFRDQIECFSNPCQTQVMQPESWLSIFSLVTTPKPNNLNISTWSTAARQTIRVRAHKYLLRNKIWGAKYCRVGLPYRTSKGGSLSHVQRIPIMTKYGGHVSWMWLHTTTYAFAFTHWTNASRSFMDWVIEALSED